MLLLTKVFYLQIINSYFSLFFTSFIQENLKNENLISLIILIPDMN